MTSTHLRLVSNVLCPYTQRAAIQLAEKDIEFQRVYIDLADKPAWFASISPLGKVPVLQVGDAAIFESAVICEFIEDAFHAVPLERLLIETDAPDQLLPEPDDQFPLNDKAGKPLNHPANLSVIYEFVAKERGMSLAQFAEQLEQNFLRLFAI